jgi:small subunit ribosomal protein S1
MTSQTPEHDDPIHQAMEASLQQMKLSDTTPERWAPREGRAGPVVKQGTVVSVTDKDVFVELGPAVQGVAALAEFAEPPEVGQTFDFVMRGAEGDLWLVSRSSSPAAIEAGEPVAVGAQVQAKVVGANTGGLELKVGNRPAFMPASHIGLERVEELSSFINQTLVCEVIEIDKSRKRLLLSRRVILAREREQARSKSVASLQVGQIVKGTVRRLEGFGAFVEIGAGTEGLLHVSNISRSRVENPADVLKVGQQIEVVILDIKEGGKRIGLGMKQLEPNPWDDIAERMKPGTMVRGKVTRVTNFGAFVEIEPGLEGLAHISQLSNSRIRRATDAVRVGDTYEFRVVAVEPDQERLGLSRLDGKGAVIGAQEEAPQEEIEQVVRQQPEQRKSGGTNLGDLLRRAMKDK